MYADQVVEIFLIAEIFFFQLVIQVYESHMYCFNWTGTTKTSSAGPVLCYIKYYIEGPRVLLGTLQVIFVRLPTIQVGFILKLNFLSFNWG